MLNTKRIKTKRNQKITAKQFRIKSKQRYPKINLPQLNENQINTQASPITQDALFAALKRMPNNKAPGLDGFPAEFNKQTILFQFGSTFHKDDQ